MSACEQLRNMSQRRLEEPAVERVGETSRHPPSCHLKKRGRVGGGGEGEERGEGRGERRRGEEKG